MGNRIAPHPQESIEEDSLYCASCLLIEANRTLRDAQLIVAAVLRYAMRGISITNNLMDLITACITEESSG